MLSTITPYIAPLLVFGLVVFVHELGHFLAAKLGGVYAPVFSLGWGRRLFGWRRGETDYRISLIPLGGYVRMASRDDDAMAGIEGGADRGTLDPTTQRPPGVPASLWDVNAMAPFGPHAVPRNRWVEEKSTGVRVFILSAGVLMNILLTLVVSTGIFYAYGNVSRPPVLPAVLDSVTTGGPAAAAGVRGGDQIVAINGVPVDGWDRVIDKISATTQGPVTLTLQRAGETVETVVTPEVKEIKNAQTGAVERVGRIGVAVHDSIIRTPVGLGEAMGYGGRATLNMAASVANVLGELVRGKESVKNLGGPIAIARTSVQAAKSGAETLWSLIAFLSLNIAILNLVPIPVLDGGQILVTLLERVKGREFSMRTREAFARAGVLAVLALILLVTYNDLRSFFT